MGPWCIPLCRVAGIGVAWCDLHHPQQSSRGYLVLPMSRRFLATRPCLRHPRRQTRPFARLPIGSLQGFPDMATCKNRLETRLLPSDHSHPDPKSAGASPASPPLRLLRLHQVMDMTGLGRTKIYALQAEGSFPMRVHITPCCVAWVEHEIQAWISERIAARAALLSPAAKHVPGELASECARR